MLAGSIYMFAGSTVPNGLLECDGSAVSRETYAILFGVIGTTYGDGDGSTTFNLPDLSGKVVMGYSQDYALGTSGGSETVTLTSSEIPEHEHEVGSHTHGNTIAASYPELSHTITQPAYNYSGPNGKTGTIRNGAYPVTATAYTGASNATASRTNASVAAHDEASCTVSGEILASPDTETGAAGSDGAHNNMQPYITMKYVIATGV